MSDLPANWLSLLVVIFFLGARHGLDADHLATIDGVTRFSAAQNLRWAKWCGVFFSLGHSLVVIVFALVVALFAQRLQLPDWIEFVGAATSFLFLVGLGVINLATALSAGEEEVVVLKGLKSRLLNGLIHTGDPLSVGAIGAVFAVSFDTLSQITLFALSSLHFGGVLNALVIGLVFAAGMILADGLNGLLICKMCEKAQSVQAKASRLMAFLVAFLSFAVAAFGAISYFLPDFAAAAESYRSFFGVGTILVMVAGFSFCLLKFQPGRTA